MPISTTNPTNSTPNNKRKAKTSWVWQYLVLSDGRVSL